MKDRIYLIPISIFLSMVLIFFLVWPKYQKLTSLKKEILAKESEVQSQKNYFEELKRTSEELKNFEDILSKIDLALPQKTSMPEFLNFIQKSSAQSGLTLKAISSFTITPSEGGKINEIRISLTLGGSYSDFKNYLSVLEKSARLIEVENITFSSEKEGQFTFSLTLKVYSY